LRQASSLTNDRVDFSIKNIPCGREGSQKDNTIQHDDRKTRTNSSLVYKTVLNF